MLLCNLTCRTPFQLPQTYVGALRRNAAASVSVWSWPQSAYGAGLIFAKCDATAPGVVTQISSRNLEMC